MFADRPGQSSLVWKRRSAMEHRSVWVGCVGGGGGFAGSSRADTGVIITRGGCRGPGGLRPQGLDVRLAVLTREWGFFSAACACISSESAGAAVTPGGVCVHAQHLLFLTNTQERDLLLGNGAFGISIFPS